MSSTAITRDFRVAGQDAEHGGLVDAVIWRGARVVAQLDDGIAPGAGAKDVADVRDCVAEGEALFVGG